MQSEALAILLPRVDLVLHRRRSAWKWVGKKLFSDVTHMTSDLNFPIA